MTYIGWKSLDLYKLKYVPDNYSNEELKSDLISAGVDPQIYESVIGNTWKAEEFLIALKNNTHPSLNDDFKDVELFKYLRNRQECLQVDMGGKTKGDVPSNEAIGHSVRMETSSYTTHNKTHQKLRL